MFLNKYECEFQLSPSKTELPQRAHELPSLNSHVTSSKNSPCHKGKGSKGQKGSILQGVVFNIAVSQKGKKYIKKEKVIMDGQVPTPHCVLYKMAMT